MADTLKYEAPTVLAIGPDEIGAALREPSAAEAMLGRMLREAVEGYDPGGCCILVVSMPGFQGQQTKPGAPPPQPKEIRPEDVVDEFGMSEG
jgi:hypothetical protein